MGRMRRKRRRRGRRVSPPANRSRKLTWERREEKEPCFWKMRTVPRVSNSTRREMDAAHRDAPANSDCVLVCAPSLPRSLSPSVCVFPLSVFSLLFCGVKARDWKRLQYISLTLTSQKANSSPSHPPLSLSCSNSLHVFPTLSLHLFFSLWFFLSFTPFLFSSFSPSLLTPSTSSPAPSGPYG